MAPALVAAGFDGFGSELALLRKVLEVGGIQNKVGVQGAVDAIESGGWRQALAGLDKGLEGGLEEGGFGQRVDPAAQATDGGLLGGDAQADDLGLVEKTAMGLLADGTRLLATDAVRTDRARLRFHVPPEWISTS